MLKNRSREVSGTLLRVFECQHLAAAAAICFVGAEISFELALQASACGSHGGREEGKFGEKDTLGFVRLLLR